MGAVVAQNVPSIIVRPRGAAALTSSSSPLYCRNMLHLWPLGMLKYINATELM
jgi:hypothetical protein